MPNDHENGFFKRVHQLSCTTCGATETVVETAADVAIVGSRVTLKTCLGLETILDISLESINPETLKKADAGHERFLKLAKRGKL